jgi:tetratricopeptide (TPR) repeat protein
MPCLERQQAALYDPRYHRPSLAKMLTLEAEAELWDPARDGRETAELAAAVAMALPADPCGKAHRTAALAHWHLGRALLRASQVRLAEHAFQCMFAWIPDAAPREERALACVGLAQVHSDLSNLDAATGLFLTAAHTFSRLGAADSTAACMAELGLLLLESGHLVNAGLPLRTAVGVLDRALAPSLAVRAWLALAEIAALRGDLSVAHRNLARARALYPLAPCLSEVVERRRSEARIALASGNEAEAEPLLDQVRRALLAHGSLAEAAGATHDHVLLRIDGRGCDAVDGLTAALAKAFPGAGEVWAAEIASLARLAAEQPEQASNAHFRFRQRLRQVAFPFRGRTPLFVPSRLLADRLLRRRGELEDPLGGGTVGP